MFCMYCGQQIPNGSRFCAFCGKQLDGPEPEAPETSVPPERANVPQSEETVGQVSPAPAAKKKARLPWKWTKKTVAILAAALVVIAVLVVVIVSAGRKVTVPDFNAYVYGEVKKDSDQKRVRYEGEDLREQVFEYVRMLYRGEEMYFYNILNSDPETGITIKLYTYYGGGDTDIVIQYEFDDHELTIDYGKNVKRKDTEDRFYGLGKLPAGKGYMFYDVYKGLLGDEVNAALGSAATGSNSGASASSPAVLTGKGVLPSPDAFFGGNLARLYDEDDYDTDGDGRLQSKGWKLTFKSNSEALEGFKAYAELVGGGEYAMTLTECWEDTVWAAGYFGYVFECDGSDGPEESFYQLLEDDRPMQGDLLLRISNYGDKGVCYLTMHYDPDYFTFIDSGEVYPKALSDLSGVSTNSSDVPSNSGSAIKTPCPLCNGGNCKKCGGDGLIYSYALDSNDAITCGAAYCNNGKCTNCGGDGWRE